MNEGEKLRTLLPLNYMIGSKLIGEVDRWGAKMLKFKVKVVRNERTYGPTGYTRKTKCMTVDFYMGMGHVGKDPTMLDVLSCLVMDEQASELTFEEFCSDFGYNSDSIKDKSIYDDVVTEGKKFRRFADGDIERLRKAFADY